VAHTEGPPCKNTGAPLVGSDSGPERIAEVAVASAVAAGKGCPGEAAIATPGARILQQLRIPFAAKETVLYFSAAPELWRCKSSRGSTVTVGATSSPNGRRESNSNSRHSFSKLIGQSAQRRSKCAIDERIFASCGTPYDYVAQYSSGLIFRCARQTDSGERRLPISIQRLFQGKPVATVICWLTGNRRG
jgi:hypothetical protein